MMNKELRLPGRSIADSEIWALLHGECVCPTILRRFGNANLKRISGQYRARHSRREVPLTVSVV